MTAAGGPFFDFTRSTTALSKHSYTNATHSTFKTPARQSLWIEEMNPFGAEPVSIATRFRNCSASSPSRQMMN